MTYYDTVGVDQDVSQKQIKKAFKRLAFKYHPDHSDREDAKERFIEIYEAYDVLSDPTRRQRYDRIREQNSSSARNYTERSKYEYDQRRAREQGSEYAEQGFEDFKEWLNKHGADIAETAVSSFFIGSAIYFLVPIIGGTILSFLYVVPVLGVVGYGVGAGVLGIALMMFWEAPGAAGCWVAFGEFLLLPLLILHVMSGDFDVSELSLFAEFVIVATGTGLLYFGANTLYKNLTE